MKKTASIVAVAKLEVPVRVETHFDEAVLCAWVDRGKNLTSLTLNFSSDSYADGVEGSTKILTAEAPGESSGVCFDREMMYSMDEDVSKPVDLDSAVW